MIPLGLAATALVEQRARESEALLRTIHKDGTRQYVEKRLRPLLPLIPDGTTPEDLARHARWELSQAATRAELCQRHCPPNGGACDSETGYYGEGREPAWQDGFLRPQMCSKWANYARRRKLERAGFPPVMLDVSFQSYKPCNESQERGQSIVQKYAHRASDESRILIYGPTGVGKTHLAASALHILEERGKTVMFAYVPDFIDQVRREMLQGETITFHRACTVDFLLMDDLGAERATDFVREKLEVLLNTRVDGRKAILFTQNLPMAELSESLGSPVVRRIVQGVDHMVEITGSYYEAP